MTSLRLQALLPQPLKEKLTGRQSDIWLQNCIWERPERIFVQAPSGAGKSTLIHILYGIRRDFDGSVLWAEKSVSGMDDEALSRLRREAVSIVFQDLRLFPELTAWENLEIKRSLTNTVAEQEVRQMMEQLGIADRAEMPAARLSYGEQQRVAIIRALIQPFQFLLLDEPFSHLDEKNKRQAAAMIEAYVQRNEASLLLAELDENDFFAYTHRLKL